MADSEIESRLDSIIDIFRCLHERDQFLQTYQKELSNRLLNKTSVSMESEELMLAKLKMEVGIVATNKLEQMFLDLRQSKELQ